MNILQTLLSVINRKSEPAGRSQPSPEPARPSLSKGYLHADLTHYDGYIREAALRRAARLASPELLPAIAERLNDWVPQVRTVARDVLLGMLPALGGEDALRLLPRVERLHRAGRADHSAWIASFEQALLQKVGPQAIVDGVNDPDVHFARACCKLVQAERLIPLEDLIARLLPSTRDIVLASHAVEAIFRLPGPARELLYRRALASGFGMVRAIALRPLLAEQSVENDALAIRMVTDLQTWIRLIASGYLKRRGIDVAALLVEALCAEGASSTTMRACLAGLAEQGARDRLDLVRDFTHHPVARVQLSAYVAWLRLEPSRRDGIALEALRSPHRRVRKFVLQLVREEGVYIETGTALSLMAVHDDIDMMFTLARRDPWSWLELVLQMEPRSLHDPALRERLEHELADWLQDTNRTFVKPSPAQRALFESGDTIGTFSALLKTDERKLAQRLGFELGKA
jgi:hypothetical protein